MIYTPKSRIRAPEFKTNLVWYNTDRPLTMESLKGKIVLLDFWTYCCINCMHILPDLKKLEKKFAKQIVVIGVHSPKFENEKVEENVRQATLRYNIEHPVVCDPEFTHWRSFAIRAWPTVAVIDPEGFLLAIIPGEGNFEAMNQMLEEVIPLYREKGVLDEEAFDIRLEKNTNQSLLYPGKIFADSDSDLLYISDSNHHRIVIADESGKVEAVVGSEEPGCQNGSYKEASFFHPQGICRYQDFLYVADTENHLLRKIDLKRQQVSTVAGTGKQSQYFSEGGAAATTALNSPWDLVVVPPYLYIAMAGSHQIWRYHLEGDEIRPFAGSGREACLDGSRDSSAFAQPSGITTDGKYLYVADSEVSAIRMISLAPEGKVETLVGEDLFVFGDRDGKEEEVLLQHPLAVLYANQSIYIADTYNHKIKQLDLKTLECKTIAGTGFPAKDSEDLKSFFEPGGIAFRNGKLFVADTNLHRILKIYLDLDCDVSKIIFDSF